MPINSSSIPGLRVARKLKKRKRAEGGGIFDWSGVGEAMPENIGKEHIIDPMVTIPKSMLWDLPHRAIDAAKNTTYGLRREDFTDVPPDYSPDQSKAIYDWGLRLPKGGWQPTDDLIGASLEGATNVMGGTALSAPAKGVGEFVAGAGPRDPALWHGISKVRLPKPISEMSAVHTPVPGGVPEQVINPAALQDSRLVPLIGDRTGAGTRLTQVNGYKFENPVEMEGGHGFMAQNADQGAAWAADKAPAHSITNLARRVGSEGEPVYGVFTGMSERSGDFSHHMSDTLSEMIKHSKITKAGRREFDDAMREIDPAWPGVKSEKLRGYLAGTKGSIRSDFAKLMDTAKYQKEGFPSVAEARFATTDPRLLNQPTLMSGQSIARLNPERGAFPSTHGSYGTNVPGQYVGGLPESIPVEMMYPNMTRELTQFADKTAAAGKMRPRLDYLMARTPQGLARTEKVDQQWVDTVSKHLEDRGFKLGAGANDQRAAGVAFGDDVYRELANQRRAQGMATGKPAKGWNFKRPDPEAGSFDRLNAEARGRYKYQQDTPDSPLMTPEDYTFMRGPSFGAGAGDKRAVAPVFFSHLERSVADVKQPAMSGQEWLNILNNRGVKAEEMQFTGLGDYLAQRAGQPVSKADVAAHLDQNKIQLGEVNRFDKRTETTGETLFQARDRTAQEMFGRRFTDLSPDQSDAVIDAVASVQPTKYHSYQLPGGENYREKLLTLPDRRVAGPKTFAQWAEQNGLKDGPEARAQYSEWMRSNQDVVAGENYKSSHWDEPNVMAHRRTNERNVGEQPTYTVVNQRSGNRSQAFTSREEAEAMAAKIPGTTVVEGSQPIRSLHIEEIQSDWHQAGRKQGYRGEPLQYGSRIEGYTPVGYSWGKTTRPGVIHVIHQLKDAQGRVVAEGSDRVAALKKSGLNPTIPDAPFKKNWHEIAVKDAIREAAEKGINRISWTPGAAQAERYDLSKQISRINYYPSKTEGKFDVRAYDLRGREVLDKRAATPDELEGLVGKEVAQKIAGGEGEAEIGSTSKTLSGLDLKVGGEGMRGFYDKILPDYLNKIGKPHGVKVQTGKTGLDRPGYDIIGEDGANYATFKGPPTQAQLREIAQQNLVPFDSLSVRKNKGMEGDVHYMDIPQSLKDEALYKGFRLGAGATDKRAASLAAVDDVLEAERRLAGTAHEPPAISPERSAAPAAGEVGSGGRGAFGAGSLPEAQATAARWAGERQPLPGSPGPLKINGQHFVPGPIGKIHDVAEAYMRSRHPDRPYTPPTQYHPLDPEHSKAIAQAYEDMKHTPNDPATKASYDALIDETAAQYQAIKATGLKIDPIPAGMPDPYAANPRMAAIDVAENNHLWFYPTEQGFGTVNKISDNPMLRPTGEKIGGHELLANDMFRIVHDYFGHLKEGHGFRAAGEDNAWRTHSAMYSDIARPAMTTETRGQNSWVNYGPHGEKNRTASAADTVYADQKVGLLPEWTMRDRGTPEPIMFYHGTPHSFDRFDISKIGGGEGNQAFGHGLYFAGNEPVSEWYRHQLAVRADPLLKKYGMDETGVTMGFHLANAGGDAQKLIAEYAAARDQLMAEGASSRAAQNQIREYNNRIAYLSDPQRSRGHMYQVTADVDPQRLLDYEALFKDQTPYVQERVGEDMEKSVNRQIRAIKATLESGSQAGRPLLPGNRRALEGRLLMLEQAGHTSFPGKEIYKRIGLPAKSETEGNIQASKRLLERGVPGLRYLDAGSRVPGESASRNYVMFDDSMLRVLRKYGVVGIPAAGVLGLDGEERRATGGKVNAAMEVARRVKRAKGGKVHIGPIVGDTGGRADKVPMSVPDGAYVIPADIVSGLGEGNTGAGMLVLADMFPESKPSLMRGMPHKGVPILAADGEFVISPDSITQRWGDLESGHKSLDAWVLQEREHLIDTLSNLDPPAQD